MLQNHARTKKQEAHSAAGFLQQTISSNASAVSAAGRGSSPQALADGSGLFSQHRTSQLQQKLLTKQLEVSKDAGGRDFGHSCCRI